MAWLQHMHAELDADTSSPEQFAAAARDWLTGTLGEVFPNLRERLTARTPEGKESTAPVSSLPLVRPARVVAWLETGKDHPVFGVRKVRYSERAWERFLSGLNEYPYSATVTIRAQDDRGDTLPGLDARARVVRDSWSPTWTSFTFTAPAGYTGWPESGPMQDVWAQFVKAQAVPTGAVAGGMTDDIFPGETALQRATFNTAARINGSRNVLRGYSWVTVVAPELAGRLGGAGALTASGAFYEVSVLPSGALWLRATPTINEFTGDRIRAVFEALAPVLVTGTTEFRFGESYRIVEGANAGDYQGRFVP